MNILVESVMRFECGFWKIRVWREGSVLNWQDVDDVLAKALRVTIIAGEHLAKELLSLDGVNAVEVVNSIGSGWVVYRDWP